MSGPYDYPMNIPPLDQFDPNYPIYDQQYGVFQRLSGPPTLQDGFAFWYRPDSHSQESLYVREPTIFGQQMPMHQTITETQSIKHRRTRSGCFTCRSRRVKCDETRPVCERCRKGNRQCEFPANTSSAKRSKSGEPKSATSETASDKFDKLDPIKDESEEDDYEEEDDDELMMPPPPRTTQVRPKLERVRTGSLSGSKTRRSRQQSTTSAASHEKLSPSTTEATDVDTPVSPTTRRRPPSPSARWKRLKPNLKPEIEKYLRFQSEHMTHYHYLFRLDVEDFVHGELIDLALGFDPLLCAVVAFAAYHHTIQSPDSRSEFNDFWKYYCRSIVSLRKYLESQKERNDVVLLTVLQLATFEEYMGDWTNLLTHHKAAHGILTSRYTKETIMESDRGRKMFDWFARLDVISGLMAVRDISLDRSWLAYAHDWHKQRMGTDGGNNLENTMESITIGMALIGHDIAHIFAQANAALEEPGFSIDTVIDQVKPLHAQLDELRKFIQELNNPDLADVDEIASNSEGDVFPTEVPLFRGQLWPLNFVWIDWYGVLLLLRNQTLLAMRKAQSLRDEQEQQSSNAQQEIGGIPPELTECAKTQCEIFNAIAKSPTAPAGATISCYSALGLSAVFLPRPPPASNSKYVMWARRQLAQVEQQGYVWPPHFRKEMAKLWDDPSIEDWWLPNNDGKSRILTEIRAVVEDRIAAVTRGPDDGRSDLREIKGLFEKMDLSGSNRRRFSATLDPSYINSSVGMAHAASMVSTPDDGSSAGSASGFSPRTSGSEVGGGNQQGRVRKTSRAGALESSLMPPARTTSDNRMSGIWEEDR